MKAATLIAVATILLLGGAGAADEMDEAPEKESDLDSLIAEILAGPEEGGYSESRRCLVSGRIDRTEVLSERLIAFHLRGGEKYVVQFKHRCPGLRRNGLTRVERRSMHICANDTIQGLYGMGPADGFWGPRCRLPEFEPVTEAQIAFLKEALKSS
ncbi:MAG: hypothetical protein OXP28_13860 [Gammaproteobacteria bacterium]|nr:hypothetical protein [Gammaproteobacteria bacterium]MDE0226198.1 hypothetical protein [Gammaproteobacteria bacterium]